MEKAEIRKRIGKLFFFVYSAFAIIIIYLLFANFGLEFITEETEEGYNLYLKNNSLHIIRDINVVDDEGNAIAFIRSLHAGNKREIEFESVEEVTLKALAPYHLTVTITMPTGLKKPPKLSYNASYPRTVLADESFNIDLEMCNAGSGADVSISAMYDREAIDVAEEEKSVFLGKNECSTVGYEFLAKKTGTTRITFKIESANFIEDVGIDLEIE